jgi:hypothetical protein
LPIRFDVTSVTHVDQGDVHLLAPSDDHRLTLVTQTGGQFSNERVVISAVSGDQGKLEAASRVPANSQHGSDIFNATVGLFILLVGGSIFAVRELGRRHRTVMAVVVVMPLMAGALVAFLLEADLVLLPPLH